MPRIDQPESVIIPIAAVGLTAAKTLPQNAERIVTLNFFVVVGASTLAIWRI
jgi:hypothetical protein